MTDEATLAGIDVAAVKRRLHSSLIAVSGNLNTPYIDASDKTPWSTFVQPMVAVVDDALDTLAADNRRLSAALAEQQRENERLRASLAMADHACATANRLTAGQKALTDKAEAALADLRAQVSRLHCWTNEDGKRFVFADDLVAVLAAAPSGEQR